MKSRLCKWEKWKIVSPCWVRSLSVKKVSLNETRSLFCVVAFCLSSSHCISLTEKKKFSKEKKKVVQLKKIFFFLRLQISLVELLVVKYRLLSTDNRKRIKIERRDNNPFFLLLVDHLLCHEININLFCWTSLK